MVYYSLQKSKGDTGQRKKSMTKNAKQLHAEGVEASFMTVHRAIKKEQNDLKGGIITKDAWDYFKYYYEAFSFAENLTSRNLDVRIRHKSVGRW